MVNFAIIGCGRIAERHAEHISKMGKLVAICDVKPERLELFEEKYGAKKYSNIDQLLEEEKNIDVVSICTPNGLHAEHSIKALKAGNDVLCEKPMALTSEDCGKMVNESLSSGKRLFIVKQNRFNPPIVRIKKVIDEGKLGKILSVQLNCFWNRNNGYYDDSDWKGTASLDGGTLFTQFSHFIDLLYWIVGDVEEVKGFKDNFKHKDNVEFEDAGVAILKFSSGTIGTINYTINTTSKNMEGSLTIIGEKGTVKVGGQYLNELEYQQIESYEIKDIAEGNGPNNYGTYVGSMSNHDKVYQNIIDVLENNGTIKANAFEGMKTIEIIQKIYSESDETKNNK